MLQTETFSHHGGEAAAGAVVQFGLLCNMPWGCGQWAI
jgi:hypothetical protein